MNKELFERGLKTRREVLGAAYVDKAIANADDFNRDMQELVTQYCWGDVWNRPGLDKKIRSIINLAMLTALNRPHELKLHVRGALNNGLTKDEIKESFCRPPFIVVFRLRLTASEMPKRSSPRTNKGRLWANATGRQSPR